MRIKSAQTGSPILAVWYSESETACWYVAGKSGNLWRAWIWGESDAPPDAIQQEGYRRELAAGKGVVFG